MNKLLKELLMKRQEETLFTPKQKFNWWGDGLWIHEPDLVTFEHEGVECKAMRIIAKEKTHPGTRFWRSFLRILRYSRRPPLVCEDL